MGIEEILPDMTTISEAVILMAGQGSRSAGIGQRLPKAVRPGAWPSVDLQHLGCFDPRRDQNRQLLVVGYESGRMIEQPTS